MATNDFNLWQQNSFYLAAVSGSLDISAIHSTLRRLYGKTGFRFRFYYTIVVVIGWAAIIHKR